MAAMTPTQGQVADAGADPRLDTLRTFSRTLRRETHTLSGRPGLLWQQLYNRLQWEGDPVPGLLEPELQRRSARGAATWLWVRTRLRESEALRLTLGDHTDPSKGIGIPNIFFDAVCAISPDSDFVVTASDDHTCMIWDAATGKERATLSGHTGRVSACAISPDSDFVISVSDDNCRIWDAATGKPRVTLTGASWVLACAISPDSDFVVAASRLKTCTIWDAATGEERATLTGHTDLVTACAISPDSNFVITASPDGTCRIWDATTGEERLSLPLLGSSSRVALHPWKPFAACGDAGGSVYLIDLVGIEYGPIIVTAVDRSKGAGPALRCPKCLRLRPLDDTWLGEVIECPTPNCRLSLRVNPFVTKKPNRGHWWSRH